MSKHHAHGGHAASHPKTPPCPFVEVTFVFRDALKHPIAGLGVRVKTGSGAPPAPQWKIGPDMDDSGPATPPAPASAASTSVTDAPTAVALSTVPSNSAAGATDQDGYAVTIRNAARNQPIDVLVKNRRGEYVWKATVTPKKDISAFTVVSPEYHLEATTQLAPKDELEQDLHLPVVKDGEVMTIERLFHEFGPYIGSSQKVTEQGKVRKDFPKKHIETGTDAKGKRKTVTTIEHHYKIVDTGRPQTIVFNLLGSRLNYPESATFSEAQYQSMASKLSVEVAAIKAIVMQESQGQPFLENGLPPILYERRHFFSLAVAKHKSADKKLADVAKNPKVKTKKKASHKNPYPSFPELCFPNGKANYGPGGLHQYEKLIRASRLDFEIALQACSWGGFQILGEYYSSCDCATIFEFANQFLSGTEGQAKIFTAFMLNLKPDGVVGLRTHNWELVARSYNGKNWKDHNPHYAANLAKYYAQFK